MAGEELGKNVLSIHSGNTKWDVEQVFKWEKDINEKVL